MTIITTNGGDLVTAYYYRTIEDMKMSDERKNRQKTGSRANKIIITLLLPFIVYLFLHTGTGTIGI